MAALRWNRRRRAPLAPIGRAGRTRPLVVAGTLAGACLAWQSPASAEQPAVTSQARTANAAFLAYAPPPPGGAVAVCLVDTGVDPNPDTEHAIVHRESMDGGDPGDAGPTKHGTSMAMTMAGPENGWGSVGAWPHLKIVSIRASAPGETYFPFSAYKRAVDRCRKHAQRARIAVVNLSLGGRGADASEKELLQEQLGKARDGGMTVVAAAVNGGVPVEPPAALPEAFAVGAAHGQGSLCSFSARGPEIDLLSLGCGLDVATPDGNRAVGAGTSDAAAFVSAVLAALRSYRPDLSRSDAEALLTSTARPHGDGGLLDVEAAFQAAGLADVVASGRARVPQAPPEQAPSGTDPAVDGPSRAPAWAPGPSRPRVARALLRNGHLRLRVSRLRAGELLVARVEERLDGREFGRGVRVLVRRTPGLSIRLRSRRWRLVLHVRGPGGRSPRSVISSRSAIVRTSTR